MIVNSWEVLKGHSTIDGEGIQSYQEFLRVLASMCRWLRTFHLVPLYPGIQHLHHEGVLPLRASHILVEYAREKHELDVVTLVRPHWNDREPGCLRFVSVLDLPALDESFVGLNRVLTPNNIEVC